MDDETTHAPDPQRPRAGSWWSVAVPALTFLVGLGLGAVVLGVSRGGDDGGDAAGSTGPGSSSSATAVPGSGDGTAVVVPDSCLRAAATVDQATGLIRQGVGAVRDFAPDTLISLLDRLEDLDALARQQAATCTGTRVRDVPLDGSPTPSATPTPTTSSPPSTSTSATVPVPTATVPTVPVPTVPASAPPAKTPAG